MKTRTALITGASSGIGRELANLFAADGYRLILVARDEHTLNKTGEALVELGASGTVVIPKDLSADGAAEELFLDTEMRGEQVDVLVNDAGAARYGLFHQSLLADDAALIRLNVLSLTLLTRLYLEGMVQRKQGRILQLADVSAYQPSPLLAVYAATKAYVLSFSDAVANEVRDAGVTITSLIPGPTETEFFFHAHMERSAATENAADAREIAQLGYDALMKGHLHAAGPGVRRDIVISAVLPNKLVAKRVRKELEQPKDGEE